MQTDYRIKLLSVILLALIMLSLPLQAETQLIRMATTTSTQNSGLLDHLLPRFQQESNIEVQVIAVGTGKALKMGRDGDVDVVMVHAKAAEEKFVNEGYGIDRLQFMINDFVLIGPKSDPAKIRSANSAAEALKQIYNHQARFISRGDDSGTHKKERALWHAADIAPSGDSYLEAGQGMGKVLQMAGELQAYTLADRGTWLAYNGKVDLSLLFSGDQGMNNPYGIIAVNPKKHKDTRYGEVKQLIKWIGSPQGQKLIAGYRLNGEQLFKPLLLK